MPSLLVALLLAASFPGPAALVSANGRYRVGSMDLETPDLHGMQHLLLVQDMRTGGPVLSHPYRLGLEALWSPEGALLALTDHLTADVSVLWLFRFRDEGEPERLDLGALIDERAARGAAPWRKAKRRHVRADGWKGGRLVVLAEGSGPAGGYRRRFAYDPATGAVEPLSGRAVR
jgi:hypothetical protein